MDSLQDHGESKVGQNVSWKLQKLTSDGALVQSLCSVNDNGEDHSNQCAFRILVKSSMYVGQLDLERTFVFLCKEE